MATLGASSPLSQRPICLCSPLSRLGGEELYRIAICEGIIRSEEQSDGRGGVPRTGAHTVPGAGESALFVSFKRPPIELDLSSPQTVALSDGRTVKFEIWHVRFLQPPSAIALSSSPVAPSRHHASVTNAARPVVLFRPFLRDTAGQERYASLAPLYYRGASAACVVFDITNADSFRVRSGHPQPPESHLSLRPLCAHPPLSASLSPPAGRKRTAG